MNIKELSKKLDMTTTNFIILSFVTFFVYPVMWLYKNNGDIETALQTKLIDSRLILVVAVLVGLMHGCPVRLIVLNADLIYFFAPIVIGVIYVIWALNAKKAIELIMKKDFETDFKMNLFATIILNIYYISYCIEKIGNGEDSNKTV